MKRRKLLLRICILTAVIGLLVIAALNIVVCATANGRMKAPGEAADCILILGCGVRPDGTPSLMLRDRLDAGIRLYHAGAAPKLLMSGDHGTVAYDEVNAMRDYAEAAGVPKEDIFMDHAGFSTYESMYRAGAVFRAERVIVVSQRYHLWRAVYDGLKLGLDCWGVPAEDIAYLGQAARGFREILARAKDCIWCVLRPAPTFLGEAIPIWGDGTITEG